MLKIFKSFPEGLQEFDDIDEVETGTWFNLVKPTPQELQQVAKVTEAPLDMLRAALDEEESSRIELDDNHILVLTNIPRDIEDNRGLYDTYPLGIVISPDYFITVCLESNDVIESFSPSYHRLFSTFKRTRFLFQILYRTALLFLKDLRQMNRRTDEIERHLRKSMKNEELFQLLDLQKGLTYFSTALRSNRIVIERLLRWCANPNVEHLIKIREEDEDLLDDVKIEYDQAIEMVQIHGDVLAGMMDAFASVISNNLNIVMKFLASVTIVMAVPTIIASFFGMNVPVPWGDHQNGFLLVGGVSLGCCAVATYYLWKKKMF